MLGFWDGGSEAAYRLRPTLGSELGFWDGGSEAAYRLHFSRLRRGDFRYTTILGYIAFQEKPAAKCILITFFGGGSSAGSAG